MFRNQLQILGVMKILRRLAQQIVTNDQSLPMYLSCGRRMFLWWKVMCRDGQSANTCEMTVGDRFQPIGITLVALEQSARHGRRPLRVPIHSVLLIVAIFDDRFGVDKPEPGSSI